MNAMPAEAEMVMGSAEIVPLAAARNAESSPFADRHLERLRRSHIDLDLMIASGSRTIETLADLPDEFASMDPNEGLGWAVKKYGPGILVVHAPIFEGGERWAQFRPDDTPVDEHGKQYGKYNSCKGSQRLMFDDSLADRIETAEHLDIIEGTFQYRTWIAMYRNDPTRLGVGVPGCWNFGKGGYASAELRYVLRNRSSVNVGFDYDVKTKEPVFRAGNVLDGLVEQEVGFRPKFTGLVPDGSSKAMGLDDWASQYDNAEEAREKYEHVKVSKRQTKFLPARYPGPKETGKSVAKLDQSPVLDRANERIIVPQGNAEYPMPPRVLAGFLLEIAAVYRTVDKVNESDPDTVYLMRCTQAGRVYEGEVAVDKVGDIEYVMKRLGVALPNWVNLPGYPALIVGAVRADALARGIEEGMLYLHHGLDEHEDGSVVFVHSAGAVTSTGHTDRYRADFPRKTVQSKVDFSIIDGASDKKIRKAVRAQLDGATCFADPTWWIAETGYMACAMSGIAPESALLVVGDPGSGKSTVKRCSVQSLGPKMRLFKLTGKSGKHIADTGDGMHHLPVMPDDFMKSKDPRKQAEIEEGLETVVSRSYEADSARAVKEQNERNGKWVNGEGDQTQFAAAMTAEFFPVAFEMSRKQRILSIQHTYENLPAGTERLEDLGKSGQPNLAMAAYIRYVCQQAEDMGGLQEWWRYVGEIRKRVEKGLEPEFPAHRYAQVAAAPIVGFMLYLDMAVEVGAIDETDAKHRLTQARDLIRRAQHLHIEKYCTTGVGTARSLYDGVQELLTNGYALRDHGSREQFIRDGHCLGALHRSDNREYVCLMARPLADALRWDARVVQDLLRDLCEPSAAGKPVREVRLPGTTTTPESKPGMYWIPAEKWAAFAEQPAKQQGAAVDGPGDLTLLRSA